MLQMIIGAVAGLTTIGWAVWRLATGANTDTVSKGLFSYIGLALAASAVVELAYTLYTHGADEALDPLMLGLSAALLIQLGKVEEFDWHEALAAVLYVSVLGGLFTIRKYLAKVREPDDLATWWRSRKIWNRCKISNEGERAGMFECIARTTKPEDGSLAQRRSTPTEPTDEPQGD